MWPKRGFLSEYGRQDDGLETASAESRERGESSGDS